MKKQWTIDEIDYLKYNYANTPTIDMANYLGCTLRQIYRTAYKLNLAKSEAFLQSPAAGRLTAGHNRGLSTQFKKGEKPFNKGTKGLSGVNKTSFKKGNIPHNTRYDGAERVNVDGYIEVRISLKNWKLKHRLVWEQYNGVIPEGHNVQFIDRNKQNCTIENLRLVSKQQNMTENTIHRYPDELKIAIRTLNKLNKTIKQNEQNRN